MHGDQHNNAMDSKPKLDHPLSWRIIAQTQTHKCILEIFGFTNNQCTKIKLKAFKDAYVNVLLRAISNWWSLWPILYAYSNMVATLQPYLLVCWGVMAWSYTGHKHTTIASKMVSLTSHISFQVQDFRARLLGMMSGLYFDSVFVIFGTAWAMCPPLFHVSHAPLKRVSIRIHVEDIDLICYMYAARCSLRQRTSMLHNRTITTYGHMEQINDIRNRFWWFIFELIFTSDGHPVVVCLRLSQI